MTAQTAETGYADTENSAPQQHGLTVIEGDRPEEPYHWEPTVSGNHLPETDFETESAREKANALLNSVRGIVRAELAETFRTPRGSMFNPRVDE